jgi:hypothetical protein
MTKPQAEPSAQPLGESLAALAMQVAALRGQVALINQRLDQAGLHGDLDLAARFEELAHTVAGALDAAAPRGPAAPSGSAWIARHIWLSWPSCGSGPIRCSASTTAATSCGTAGPAISTPSGNCLPWAPNGTTSTAASTQTWPAPWSSTTAGFPAPCAASPISPGPACQNASRAAVPGDRPAATAALAQAPHPSL